MIYYKNSFKVSHKYFLDKIVKYLENEDHFSVRYTGTCIFKVVACFLMYVDFLFTFTANNHCRRWQASLCGDSRTRLG